MLKFIILAPFLIILFYSLIIQYNYNYYWQVARLNLGKKWARSASARAGGTPCQDPGGFSPPCSKILSRQPNCQIRKNKLYYQIILFSPTEFSNLNSTKKSKSKSRTVHQKLEIKSEILHLNKSIKHQQRMNKRHPQEAVQYSEINILLNLPNLNSLTNQNFIAGPNQAAEEASQLIPGTEFSIIPAAPLIELGESTSNSQEIMSTIRATGQPWEATQQTFVPHGTTSAVAQQFTEGNNSIGTKLGELTSNSQEIMPTIQATGQPWEVTQQTSVPHGTTPAVAQQFTDGNNSIRIKLGELTSNLQEIISTIQATGQPWEVTQQTSVPHGITPAVAQQFTEGNNSTEYN